mgnify:CR=1 FL=1
MLFQKQSYVDLSKFIEKGVLMGHGMGPNVVYASLLVIILLVINLLLIFVPK